MSEAWNDLKGSATARAKFQHPRFSRDYTPPTFTQVIYSRDTGEELTTNQHGSHLSPHEISERFGAVVVKMRRNDDSAFHANTIPPQAHTPVPWARMCYDQIVAAGLLDQVKSWCRIENWGSDDAAKQRRDEYVLTLKALHGFPKTFNAS